MSSPLSELQPRLVWHHFDQIRQIPRPSKKEERIRQHLLRWAAEKGYESVEDRVGNIVVRVPATSGYEAHAAVVIQGHLDMVCEKNRGTDFDFETQPIAVEVVDGWVRAQGTTLGADNGIGVAMAMAIADDPDGAHPPLELLMTIDEETGLTGATNLDASIVSGRRLLNLDSEEEGVFYIGCAGGGDDHLSLTVQRDALGDLAVYSVAVRGLRGGHSGCDIHQNRGNAVKFVARVLGEARTLIGLQLADIAGGDKHNAIPREAEATVAIRRADADQLKAVVAETERRLRTEFGKVEPELALLLDESDAASVLTQESSDRVLRLLLALPHGVDAMSRDIPGLVETSTNLAAVRVDGDVAKILTSSRSSVASALTGIRQQIVAAGQLAGCRVDSKQSYPGWAPNLDSALLKTARTVWHELAGGDPEIAAIHAGLECGVLGERVPGMDMLSFGPTITGAHSPDERMKISAVATTYHFLSALLAAL